MKLQKVDNLPVAKISDEPEKAQCQDPEFLELVKKTFNIK
jgi:nicotinate phosphoribosyltransferase